MTDLRKHVLPRLDGPVTVQYLELVLREILARQDARNPQNDFAGGLLANSDGTVTVGNDARLVSQRPLPFVNAGNRMSAQTTDPLSSAGSASTSAITIASHVLQMGDRTVSYNGGTITGLTPLTDYYVYCDDNGWPENPGGAVTYAASTSNATAVAGINRYFVGIINTANTTPTGNISAATSANPIEFTTTSAHGFTTGNTVTFTGLPGDFGTNLNGNNYTATVTGSTTFTIAVDGSLYVAYSSGGTVTRVSTPVSGGGGGGGWGRIQA